jgi:hypothetical protein
MQTLANIGMPVGECIKHQISVDGSMSWNTKKKNDEWDVSVILNVATERKWRKFEP